jgi:hypothetical protein
MSKKHKNKCYLVVSKTSKFKYGVFPFTEEGKIEAGEYADKLNSQIKKFSKKRVEYKVISS